MFSLKVLADVAVRVVEEKCVQQHLRRAGCHFLAVEMEIEVPIHPRGHLL